MRAYSVDGRSVEVILYALQDKKEVIQVAIQNGFELSNIGW